MRRLFAICVLMFAPAGARLKAANFYPYTLHPRTAQDGIQLNFTRHVAMMPFATEADYRNYLARIDGLIEQMRESMRSGEIAPKAIVREVAAMRKQPRANLAEGSLGLPFREIPAAVPKQERDELALGDRFDLRGLHGAVLDNGPLPLAMEQQVERRIKTMARDAAAPKAPSPK